MRKTFIYLIFFCLVKIHASYFLKHNLPLVQDNNTDGAEVNESSQFLRRVFDKRTSNNRKLQDVDEQKRRKSQRD